MPILAVFLKKLIILPYSVAKQLKQSEVGEEVRDELAFGDEIDNDGEDSIENDESITVKIPAKKKRQNAEKQKRGKLKKGV